MNWIKSSPKGREFRYEPQSNQCYHNPVSMQECLRLWHWLIKRQCSSVRETADLFMCQQDDVSHLGGSAVWRFTSLIKSVSAVIHKPPAASGESYLITYKTLLSYSLYTQRGQETERINTAVTCFLRWFWTVKPRPIWTDWIHGLNTLYTTVWLENKLL